MVEINSSIYNIDKVDKNNLIQELIVHQRELEMQTEELKRLNFEIESLKNHYLELFNSAPVGYVIININGIIKNCNEAFKKLIGKEVEEIVGTPFVAYLSNEDKAKFILNFREYFNERAGKKMELKIIGNNKTYTSIISAKPSLDKGSLLIAITDITELVERENLISTYMSIIEVAPVSIVITDRRNKIVYVNENYTKISGYSKEELIGKDPGYIKSGKTPKETYRELWSALRSGKSWRGRFINRKKTGELFIEEAFISPVFDKEGKVVHYIAVKRDITEEIERAEREKREEQIRFIYNISGIIAHNLNNINMPILVTAHMLKEEPELQKYQNRLNIIIESVEKATSLINKILNISKNVMLFKKAISVDKLLNYTLEKYKENIPQNINVVTQFPSLDPIKVYVDIDLISYAIYQVLKNSFEAMAEGGTVKIRVSKLEDEKESWAVIEILDQGIGISSEIIDRVFEPFFTTKLDRNALGVGLSEVRGIVEAHDGKVEIQSQSGKGTNVKIYLPIK